jgi:chromosome segregation ATPase
MRDPLSRVRLSCLAVAAFAAACVPPGAPDDSRVAERETRPAAPPTAAPRIQGDESMAALTAEIRQLRVAVEELARSQAETQALGMTLSAQQGRIQQLTQQLDAVRGGLAASAMMTQGFDGRLVGMRDELSRTTDREQRAGLEDAIRAFEAEQSQRELDLQQARAHESDLSRELAQEQARWNDTLARMEQLTR